jgi:hypothetical protein
MMKKAFKIYRWAWTAVVSATLIAVLALILHTSHHDLARDPNNLSRIVKVDLPSIAEAESEDNSSRGASRWDVYVHHGRFVEELSEATIRELDDLCVTDSLHWKKLENESYIYSDEGGVDGLYFVTCSISKDQFVLNYEVDESEGLFVLLPFAIAYTILFYWGLVLVFILLIKRIRN